ncbi:hypothetical protein ASZ78_003002 [Callipepla squamata]|uniref:Centrosomal protein of 192 kDa n=1 Tax=Callipepla squamata TaxID=9009 RepID=A0A226NH68_CALSU|nr:hypothetical protein ASZ78_003002 [Callipepla squamata]
MEAFRNIADETFPSFLARSLDSSAGALLENVTISSNLGLPVAASTVAKSKAGPDSRLSDIRASYLEEEKHSPPSQSHNIQLDAEPMGRFAFSFHDDMEVTAQVKEPQRTIASLKESYSLHGDREQNVIGHSDRSQDTLLEVSPSEPSEKLVETETSSDHLSISLSSFLENEKLSSLSSLGDSTDDDIDDEEFFDNQLEAYFEQLIPPEAIREDTNLEKLSERCTALKLSEYGLLQEDFQGPDAYQAVTGADSGNASDEGSQNQGMAGCPVQIEKPPRAIGQLDSLASRDVLESCSAAELRLDSLYLQHISSHIADGTGALSKEEVWSSEHQAAASNTEVLHPAEEFLGHYTDPKIPLSVGAPGTDADSTGCEVGLSDTYLSPTADSCQNKSLAATPDTGDAPHSVVYQNEEGKWVTDLAYYASFDEEQDLNLPEDDKINEFVTGSEAAAMIAQDQEEFEKTHRLLQAEKVDILDASELANSSWKSTGSCILPKMTDVSKDASYLRLSLGEFFGQRSEALGCLGGGSDVKRPSFGYHITSPKTRQPVALLRQFDASVSDATQETSRFSEVLPEDLEDQEKENANSTSCEGAWCSEEAAAGKQRSINAETATKSKGKGEDKLEGGLSNHSDSVLSISTIASAIADASCSADPSQLAAMIMTLSNKNRKTCFLPGVVKEMELAANRALSSDGENSTFDMEKYLRKTDEIGHESESIVKHETSVQNSMSESTLLDKLRKKETLVEDLLNDHNEQQLIEKQFLEYFNAENGIQSISSSSDASKHEDRTANSVKYSEKLSDILNSKHSQTMSALKSDVLDTQTSPSRSKVQTCETPLAAKKEMAQRLLFAQQADSLTSGCCSREDGQTAEQVKNRIPEPCNDLERSAGNTVSFDKVKPAKQPGKYVSISPTKATPVQELNRDEVIQSTKAEERTKEASTAGSGNVKHVTFEKLSTTSQCSTEHQSGLPKCDLQPLEDEQYSFRPSTSPLIHSSPSDTSGTAFSGSEADFICTSRYPESSCKESALSQSVYSSPSMSRLTYVSACDNTLKNTCVMRDPETRWSENASELSTTIIRASPTPSQEHMNKNLEDYLCQRSRKGIQVGADQKPEGNELVYLERKLEGQGQEPSKEDLPKNEKQLSSAASKVAATLEELDPAISALSSKFRIFQPLPVNVGTQEVRQDHTNKAQSQGLPSLNSLPAYPGLRTCVPINQSASGEQYVPISSFKSHVTTSESQAVSSIPMLLPGHSLATTQFVQQHLGNMPSTGNTILPQLHGCSSTGFSVPPSGFPYNISAVRVDNPVPVGIPLGSNIGPGSLGTAALRHPHSNSWSKNILNIRAYTAQPLGTGRNEWDFSMSPGVGHVKVPEELKFPNACCVGIASQTALSIFNPTERWLQVSVGILSVSVNGEKVDLAKYQCLVFKNKAIVGPHSTEDLKILFLPCHSGIFQCILSVSSWPVCAEAETVVQAEALASRVVLTAVAENPNLEVETGKQDYLDFGDLTFGSWKALPLKIVNKTHAFVPIRLIINANAVAWRCFTFSKEPVNSSNEQSLQMDAVSQVAAPSVVNHVIHASYDGQDPEVLTVWVLFHAPRKQISCSDILGPADEFLARVDVEVDSPGPSSVIESIPLRARAGTARIHAPRDLQTIHLSASVGSTAKQQLPLKNAGNIGVNLKLKCFLPTPVAPHTHLQTSEQDNCFAVEPDDLFLLPGEEREVTVKFYPKNVTSTQSVLKILVLPSGPQYEVVIKGEVESVENRLVSTAAADIPPILSNKQFVAWGGVKLGESVQQKLTLRNNSPSETQHLRLVIRGQDQDCFQLQSIFGSEERLTSNWELKIRPKEDTNIYLMFTPTRVTCFFAKLEIKQLGMRSQPGIKFTIPLSGYGGTSSIILESVKKLSDSYMLTLDGLLPSSLKRASFHIRNTGSRAAYVKALCFANLQTKTVVDPQVMTVSPEKFILREGAHEMITVTWNPIEKERYLLKAKTLLSTICFFWGDEISRQRYRRAIMCELEVAKPIVPENSLLRNIVFDEEFQGEQLVTEVCDIPRGTNDIRLFYANMRKIILTVVGYFVVNRDGCQQPPGHHLESNRSENAARLINATLDVLPVKGPQGPPLPVKTKDLVKNEQDVQQTWAVKPEHLVLLPPSISGTADTGHVHIVNNSSRMLTFELSWPAHCLTVTPQHGVIEPESRALILVSPNPSLATKPSVIPWSGLIYIHCDNGRKDMDGTGSVYRATYSAFRCYRVSGTLEAHGKEKVPLIFLPRENGDYSQFWDLECHPVEKPSWKHKLRFQLSGTGTKAENTTAVVKVSTDTLTETGSPVVPKRKAYSEVCTTKAGLNEITRGVYAPEDLYTFLPTRVGESRTLKVNLRNNTFRTQLLRFLSPNEPFYIKHSKYSLRSHHYINVPVQFKPQAEGIFEGVLAVHTTKYGCIQIRLCGKAIAKE